MSLQGIGNIPKAKTQIRTFNAQFEEGKRREKPRRNEKAQADRAHICTTVYTRLSVFSQK